MRTGKLYKKNKGYLFTYQWCTHRNCDPIYQQKEFRTEERRILNNNTCFLQTNRINKLDWRVIWKRLKRRYWFFTVLNKDHYDSIISLIIIFHRNVQKDPTNTLWRVLTAMDYLYFLIYLPHQVLKMSVTIGLSFQQWDSNSLISTK